MVIKPYDYKNDFKSFNSKMTAISFVYSIFKEHEIRLTQR